jgi:Bacteriophage HK97-gp10, putative tail-component
MSGLGGQSVWFRWDGFADLIEQFRTLAHDLTEAATPDVVGAANAAKDTIRDGYPRRSGNLQDSLSVLVTTEDTRTKATVINTSPHAVYFERGTSARRTAIGAPRGSTPPNPIFSATMIRARRNLYAQPIPRVLRFFGLRVDGNA